MKRYVQYIFLPIVIFFLDDFDGYDYYGDEEEKVEQGSNIRELSPGPSTAISTTGPSTAMSTPASVLTTAIPNSTTTPSNEYLLDEIRNLHSTMADLQDMIRKLVMESLRQTEIIERRKSSGKALNKVDTDLEKFQKTGIDFEKIVVIESDFDNFPTFNITNFDNSVKRLGANGWITELSEFWNKESEKAIVFLKHAYSNVSTAIWFSLFVLGLVIYFTGICYCCCKNICCKNRCKKQYRIRDTDIEAMHDEEMFIKHISEPILWHATNTQPLVDRSQATGSAFPIPKKLERSASLNSRIRGPPSFLRGPPSFLSFGIPPPMAPIRSASLPSSPILRKRKNVTFNFDTPFASGKEEEEIEIKETTV